MHFTRRTFLKAAASAAAALGIGSRSTIQARAEASSRHHLGTFFHLPSLDPTPRPATVFTQAANAALLDKLPFDDRADYVDAVRGLIAPLPDRGYIPPAAPGYPPVWNLQAYDFLKKDAAAPNAATVWLDAPPEANPSLWRQAQLNLFNGLFEVVPGIYQVRGADLSNMTIIEGKKGIIVIDPLVSTEAAAVGLALYRAHRGARRVMAVIYTHTHTDHYGGVRGVVDENDAKARKLEIIAPDRFMEEVIKENVLAGTAMSRRAHYSYGAYLPRGPHGQIDGGLGKGMSLGHVTLIPPTDVIVRTGERRKIDGVEITFQLAPDTEAPAEFMMYLPDFRVFNSAELACAVLHNIYTPRGAQVRDASAWSAYLNEAMDLFGDGTDVLIAQHNWPTWGHDAAIDFLKRQRDLYKYLHDQTLHLANLGYTMNEIAEELARNRSLPTGLEQVWSCRGYYGTVSHNVKSVYQKYLGWYDCNPAHLEPLPPEEAGKKYVAFMGGVANIIAQAQPAFEAGEYRWVAEVMSHVVFAEPENAAARSLAADALEQLGYQAESAIWRNHYLTAALELRAGIQAPGGSGSVTADTVRAMSIGAYFDYLGVRLDARKADGQHIVLNWVFTDTGEQYALNLENSALTYRPNRLAAAADATLTLARTTLDEINLSPSPEQAFAAAIGAGQIQVTGNVQKIAALFAMLDTFTTRFNIIEP